MHIIRVCFYDLSELRPEQLRHRYAVVIGYVLYDVLCLLRYATDADLAMVTFLIHGTNFVRWQ